MGEKWRGWEAEEGPRRAYFVATAIVLGGRAVSAVVGTVEGRGFDSAWLWVGLALVPVVLWLVARAGLHK